jgi:hypothetical protein
MGRAGARSTGGADRALPPVRTTLGEPLASDRKVLMQGAVHGPSGLEIPDGSFLCRKQLNNSEEKRNNHFPVERVVVPLDYRSGV